MLGKGELLGNRPWDIEPVVSEGEDEPSPMELESLEGLAEDEEED